MVGAANTCAAQRSLFRLFPLLGDHVFDIHRRVFLHFCLPTSNKTAWMKHMRKVKRRVLKQNVFDEETNSILGCRNFPNTAYRLHRQRQTLVHSFCHSCHHLGCDGSHGQMNKQCTIQSPWPLKSYLQTLKNILFTSIKRDGNTAGCVKILFKNLWQSLEM